MTKFTSFSYFLLFTFCLVTFQNAHSQNDFLVGDALPDAPELTARGSYGVGVQTLNLVNKDQLDVLSITEGKGTNYDRPITVEIWYPATIPDGVKEIEIYTQVLGRNGAEGRPVTPFTFKGRALRDAKIISNQGKFPLVILSHGYVGSRFLFTYLAENLASKGYVVVSIDHTDSTYKDAAHFTSTLANRSLDQLFVLSEIERLSAASNDSFLANLVDTSRTGLVGYSMGGYGGLNTCGAGYSDGALDFFKSMTGGSDALDSRGMSNESYKSSADPDKITAFVALAPWGMANGVWDAEGLAGLKTPTLFVAGSEDDISGYEKGIKAIYEGSLNSDRYLLTYVNARHNVAPNPPVEATMMEGLHIDEYLRYADSVWDMRRINNINQHFITAFLGIHLKGMDYQEYLNVEPDANTGNWKGFKPRTSIGMELLHAAPKSE
ncbi:dienelactone hydrolase [Flagellimonas hymeniacidonis]|uniref:Dienelactone hydrolase n=1 Tax=Flagellimonas hymeniacidonis TaxID=2603628 RepID=A0A5C8V3W8_9FLAO|nr:dienelactone hydrolase [Flagellimonas hymeniacidonis]TXN35722.1 dienelactone hydrolase [Flagellimonas hymeniacidonis]